MAHTRGTSNGNAAGSSYARRRRKLWLLATFGDGTTAPCSFDGCEEVLTFETLTVDRFPVAGVDGGTYKRGNIRPACAFHNSQGGTAVREARKLRLRVATFRLGWAALVDESATRPPKTLGSLRVL